MPGLAIAAASFVDPVGRAVIWTAMLLWMGGACLVNARRCARRHCRFTGPFLIVMAGLVVADALGSLPLGANGWTILGGVTLIGFALLWWGTERIWDTFSRR